ncbi:MAG TPA: response regulator [Candidatus Polarisedimenticolaceae bacterium]|nr:response regulator [Candidatus Polarisedimenticolaceae bacterium]
MKILIADDDETSRVVLEATLKSLGHEVVKSDNGRTAWEAYRQGAFHAVISDWIMPEINGLELCRMIRADQGRTRAYTYVILLTVVSGKGGYMEGMSAGADDFISKPFDRDQLASRLRVAERILGLQAELRTLHGLLPICSYCKRVRDDKNYWVQVESYIADRTDCDFTHSICPSCYEDVVRPELAALPKLAASPKK